MVVIASKLSPSPFDSILDAVLTVSPNKQYLGIFCPTTPEHTAPLKEVKQRPLPHRGTIVIGCKLFHTNCSNVY